MPPATLALATLAGLASHALYASFDLVSRAVLRHGLGMLRTLLIALTSYAFQPQLRRAGRWHERCACASMPAKASPPRSLPR